MARPKQLCDYNSTFAVRLRTLINEKDTNIKKIAEVVGVTRQAISQYKQGIATPCLDKLLGIATFFNVSSDYLLGLSDVKSTDTNIKSICDYTGLSETAINNLHNSTQANRALCEEIIAVICKK